MNQWIGSKKIIEKKKQFLIPCVYHFYKNPPQMVKGEGVYLYDSEGKAYLDLYSGVSVHALGHCHPELTAAICQQVQTLQHTTTIYLNQSIVNLAESLADFLPGNLQKSFFCSSGSEASEGACLLASLYTGRNEFIALQNGLHGRTKMGMSLTGLSFWRTDAHPIGGIVHVPVCHNCSYEKECCPGCLQRCLEGLKNAIATATSGKIAGFIAEPIQGNGGIRLPHQNFFREVYKIVKEAGGLFIVDETQTGFGRTGKNFAIEHFGIVPDIICGGKALGGGTPIGFFSTTSEIADCYTRPGASTFGGNPVTAEAAIKLLEILRRDNMVEGTAEKGKFLKKLLLELQSKFPDLIKQVRGLGLMWGVELDNFVNTSAGEILDAVLEELKDQGILVGKTGSNRNVLTIMPPLIISKDQLSQGLEIITKVFQKIQQEALDTAERCQTAKM